MKAVKTRMLGNIRFIGELYKQRMLTEKIMHECLIKLLGDIENPEEDEVECLCKLMSTIGQGIDHAKAKPHMDEYFSRMYDMSQNSKSQLPNRLRFMLQEVIDLRKSGWRRTPRRRWRGRRRRRAPRCRRRRSPRSAPSRAPPAAAARPRMPGRAGVGGGGRIALGGGDIRKEMQRGGGAAPPARGGAAPPARGAAPPARGADADRKQTPSKGGKGGGGAAAARRRRRRRRRRPTRSSPKSSCRRN